MLGSGAFGKVFKTHNLKDPNIQVAIKVLDKFKMAENMESVMEEVGILNMLDHPNIVTYREVYDDKNYVYISKSITTQSPPFPQTFFRW